MAYLLDSNLLIYSANPDSSFLRPLVLNPTNFVSAISQVETLGFYKLTTDDAAYFNSAFTLLGILPVSQSIIMRAIVLRQQRRMSLGDTLIAATALEYNLEVATRNMADFSPVSGLAVYNPFES